MNGGAVRLTCINYCVLVCSRCGAANWKSEIRPSTTKKGINDVKLVCDVCGYVAFSSEDIERLAQP